MRSLPSTPSAHQDKFLLLWFVIDAFTHLFVEGSYLLLAFLGGANSFDSSNPAVLMWKEYAKADARCESPVLSLVLCCF